MKERFLVAVCDDDATVFAPVAEATERAFARSGAEAEVRCFSAPRALEDAMARERFDLILLDIEMPEEDGIHFGERVARLERRPDIIFVSSREDRVFDAFKLHPFGFVRKSCFLKDIGAAVADYVAARRESDGGNFVVRTADGTISVPVGDIVYIEGDRKNQIIHTADGGEPLVVSLTMKQLEEHLEKHGFLRVHTGFLVNYRRIHRMSAGDVTLTDGSVLPVSRRKAGQIKLDYMELLKKEGSHIY